MYIKPSNGNDELYKWITRGKLLGRTKEVAKGLFLIDTNKEYIITAVCKQFVLSGDATNLFKGCPCSKIVIEGLEASAYTHHYDMCFGFCAAEEIRLCKDFIGYETSLLDHMFDGSAKLKTIKFPSDYSLDNADFECIFKDCPSLETIRCKDDFFTSFDVNAFIEDCDYIMDNLYGDSEDSWSKLDDTAVAKELFTYMFGSRMKNLGNCRVYTNKSCRKFQTEFKKMVEKIMDEIEDIKSRPSDIDDWDEDDE